MNQSSSELLIPAGNLRKLKLAILDRVEAVYFDAPDMSLLIKSKFSLEDVIKCIEFYLRFGCRVYLTLNLFSHNKDIPKLD